MLCVLCCDLTPPRPLPPLPQRVSPGAGIRVKAADSTIDPATGVATASQLTLTVGNASLAVGNVTLPVAQAALLLPTGKCRSRSGYSILFYYLYSDTT